MGVQFGVYEALLRRIGEEGEVAGVGGYAASGCVAGMAGKVMTLPLDVAKKRMQVSYI